MIQAIWNGAVIAQSPRTIRLDGNHYFPADSVDHTCVVKSSKKSLCPWKGLARYYSIKVGGKINPDAAWYYERPSPLARKIRGHVAFGTSVSVRVAIVGGPVQ